MIIRKKIFKQLLKNVNSLKRRPNPNAAMMIRNVVAVQIYSDRYYGPPKPETDILNTY